MGLHTGWRRKSCKCCLQGDPTYSTVHSLHNTGLSRLTWCRHFGKTIFGQLHLENARDGRTDALLWCCLATSVKHGGKQSGENEKKQHIRHTDTNTQLKRWVYDGNNKTKLMRYWKKEQKKSFIFENRQRRDCPRLCLPQIHLSLFFCCSLGTFSLGEINLSYIWATQ